MNDNNTIILPNLAPPGAGLPWPTLLFLKFYVNPFVANKTDWNISEKRFLKVNQKIIHELENLNEEQLTTPVLVPPLQGLEDSSRFWSVAMTLEHLVIVGKQISSGIVDLTHHRIPGRKADIAAVKPKGHQPGADSVADFKRFIDKDFKNLMISIGDRDSAMRFKHPWFGMFNAKQWFWLLPVHHDIHLKQIIEIKRGLFNKY